MGRTVPTYRQALEERLKRWDAFGRLLTSPEERDAFERIRTGARRYVAQATYVGSPDLLESILLSILLDLAVRYEREVGRAVRIATPGPNGS